LPVDDASSRILALRNRTRRYRRHCWRDAIHHGSRYFRCNDDDAAVAAVPAAPAGAANCCACDDDVGARRAKSPSSSDNHCDDAWSPLTTAAPSGCASALLGTLLSRRVRPLLSSVAAALILTWRPRDGRDCRFGPSPPCHSTRIRCTLSLGTRDSSYRVISSRRRAMNAVECPMTK